MSLCKGVPPEFFERFEAWARIEPRTRSNDWSRGLQASVADPAWMLARQLQFGEFGGEDAGSPIAVDLKHSTQSLDYLTLRDHRVPMPVMPLETMVESEPAPLTWRFRVQIGQQFERFARTVIAERFAQTVSAADVKRFIVDFISACRQAWPLELPQGVEIAEIDQPTQRYLRFMSGRVTNGERLHEVLDRIDAETIPEMELQVEQLLVDGSIELPTGTAPEQLIPVLARLADWYRKLVHRRRPAAQGAWQNPQLNYRFEINSPDPGAPDPAQDGTHLIAPDYRNGDLDWYSFCARSGIQGRWQAAAVRTYPLPTRISAGGTSPRWWAFEDAATDFGAVDVAAPDLARLLLMEFVLVYGDDWFSVPLTVSMPSLVRIDSLRVRNVFGEELPIDPVRKVVRDHVERLDGDPDDPKQRWEIFTLAPHPEEAVDVAGLGDVLLIPPVAGFRDESKPLEAVHFLRDEGANRVWGVEQTALNGLGIPVHGFDAQRGRLERIHEYEAGRVEEELATLERILTLAGLTDRQRPIIEEEMESLRARLKLLREGPRPSSGIPFYRLMSSVPENWVPFSPVRRHGTYFGFGPLTQEIMLRRGQMLRNVDGLDPVPVPALTILPPLAADNPLSLVEESAVPRAGQRMQLTAQRVRWTDGKTYVWFGRKVLTGRGEGSSGLRFDFLRNKKG